MIVDNITVLTAQRGSRLRRGDLSGLSHTSGIKTGTPVATLPDAWRNMISAGTCWRGVSIPCLVAVESLNCNFCLSVAAGQITLVKPSLRYTNMLLGR